MPALQALARGVRTGLRAEGRLVIVNGFSCYAVLQNAVLVIFKRSNKKKYMVTDSQIFTALMVALTAAILAIGLGRQLYV